MRKIIVLLLATSSVCFGAQPWEQERTRQQQLQDPEAFDKPVTNTLKGEEIKEFRDKLNAVKAQIFAEGNVPGGAAFRSEVKDASSGSAMFQAEAKFNQFSAPIQEQIAARLPDAAASDQRILVEIPAGSGDLKVASAKFTDAKTTLVKASEPQEALSNTLPPPAVQALPPIAKPQTTALRPTAEKPAAVVAPAAAKEFYKPHISEAARSMAGNKGQIRVESRVLPAAAQVRPVAILPFQGGGELLVETVTQTLSADVQLDVRATVSQLPEPLSIQIEIDQPGALAALEPGQDVKIVIALEPDNSIRVESIQPVLSAPVPMTAQKAEPSAPAKPALHSHEPGVLLMRARELAVTLGLQPAAVSVEKRELSGSPEPRTVSVAIYTLEQGGTVVVQEGKPGDDGAPHFTAEGKFRDLSPDMKAQVTQRLSDFGGQKTISENSQVAVEVRVAGPKEMEVASITLLNPNATENQKETVLWKQETVLEEQRPESDEPAAPVEPSAPDKKGPAVDAPLPLEKAPSKVPVMVSRNVARGLAPSVSRVAIDALGLTKGNFEIRDPDPQGRLRVQTVAGAQRVVPMSFRPSIRPGSYEFSIQGRPLDFTDKVREQIFAKLKEAAEKGEAWAKEALEGKKDLVVELEAAEEGKDGPVKVTAVSATAQELAQQAAQDMGLSPGDYLLVNSGARNLLVLEKGVVARIKIGGKELKIVSPDGDAKIFLKADRAKNDQSQVFMMSRKSLKANRDAIAKVFGGEAGKAVDAALKKNPEEEQFVIRLDPSENPPALIKPMTELQPNNSIMDKR